MTKRPPIRPIDSTTRCDVEGCIRPAVAERHVFELIGSEMHLYSNSSVRIVVCEAHKDTPLYSQKGIDMRKKI